MSKVRGRFRDVDGRIDISPTLTDCSVSASIAMASVDTGTPQRDDDLRSDRFFDVDEHPAMTFASTAVEVGSNGIITIVGDLSIRAITRQVRLEAEFLGLERRACRASPGSASRRVRSSGARTFTSASARLRGTRSSSATPWRSSSTSRRTLRRQIRHEQRPVYRSMSVDRRICSHGVAVTMIHTYRPHEVSR
jgi:hypothetical protein